ncbi:hypothetical protein HBH98_054340 [Parastagonospora nodorum]|nr:hypothetical protein HBH52_147880 [Parastagonospora nodorum]KAH4055244.1 hypothetical protein HBH49_056710 [Parastagonospora nodorum]KAH4129357.1 hypothetical protein HBH47_028180 [Parastagonospora nodorum]KAH4179927.1 hypothetical protein HBH42_246770 [Parastagonospora nodorum]KAH4245060.1 hypothetical protein HBI05_063500 [Parastagonospora nodorum]
MDRAGNLFSAPSQDKQDLGLGAECGCVVGMDLASNTCSCLNVVLYPEAICHASHFFLQSHSLTCTFSSHYAASQSSTFMVYASILHSHDIQTGHVSEAADQELDVMPCNRHKNRRQNRQCLGHSANR